MTKTLNFEIGKFNNSEHVVKTIYDELRKSSMSKCYYNSVDRRDLMSICSGQMMKKSNDWIFFLNKQKPFFKPCS